MRIAVTGASGDVGGYLLAELLRYGHDVTGVDLRPLTSDGATFHQANVLSLPELRAAFEGCDAVVHLAAIREAGIAPPEVTFQVNALGTMNAIEAAVQAGASRFVLASSEAVLGFSYRTRPFKPDYFPIDEHHPLQPQDCYGVSKIAAEEICRSYTRAGTISTVCLRPCYCWSTSLGDEALESILNPELHYKSLWVYIHLRDVARAYRLACERTDIEHETMYVVASDIRSNVPTAELIDAFYSGVPVTGPMDEYSSLIANGAAQEKLGFTPELSWRDELPADDIPTGLALRR
jgi:nucleoside-diphosphate-sugar epimerase